MTDDTKDPEEQKEPDPMAEGYIPDDYIDPDPVMESLRRMRAAS